MYDHVTIYKVCLVSGKDQNLESIDMYKVTQKYKVPAVSAGLRS